eukprot:CAMPEP_0206466136 /NCGR_PEP_ID=MMETSP0324_2-20121206/28275_1 /ASSEMBLY_ACC=CAM_ASM_000836 /TAXON_ID=2866 /ORGANISM="Crypthecodinium cohnii, Strain Seligo" /LENGTH=62 /DNA_ID=CAMNT_0053939187 /DNA_START=347 /DNA_END=532 /DNA_ORIENTATION=-
MARRPPACITAARFWQRTEYCACNPSGVISPASAPFSMSLCSSCGESRSSCGVKGRSSSSSS